MPGTGLLHTVDGEHANRVDAKGIQVHGSELLSRPFLVPRRRRVKGHEPTGKENMGRACPIVPGTWDEYVLK
jgi:hypothetical protein